MKKFLPSNKNCKWLLIGVLCCLMYQPGFAQELASHWRQHEKEKDRQPGQQFTLIQILSDWEKAYNINFYYDSELLKGLLIDKDNSAVDKGAKDLEKVLTNLLTPLQLQYEKIGEDAYVIRSYIPKKHPIEKLEKKSSDTSLKTGRATGAEAMQKLQTRGLGNLMKNFDKTITGKVTDENGEGLPGVNILVKETTTGTVTDVDGNYRLNVPDDATTLVFSSVGYMTKEVPIGSQTSINIQMTPDVKALSEVVVIGYGAVEKRDLTGAVSSVNSQDIERVPVIGLDQALQGRASGVFVSNNNANPGGEVNIRIRGINSIQGNNEPLYVIDGYIGGNINTVNPTDIESIEVLKDASATSIYGSRGANGVVIVTTKMGKQGQNNLNFDMFYGWQSLREKIELMGAREYAGFINRINEDQGDPLTYPDLNNLEHNTDWQDEIMRTAPWQQYTLSAGGSTGDINYYVSGAYINQQGIVKETGYDRFNIRANIDANISERVKFGTRLGFSRVSRTRIAGEDVGRLDDTDNPVPISLRLQPTAPAYDEDGRLLPTVEDYENDLRAVPLYELQNITQDVFSTNFTGNLFAEIQLLKPLKFRTSFGFNVVNDKQNRYKPSNVWEITTAFRNNASINTRFNTGWLNENYLTFDQQFDNHSLQVLGGMTLQGHDFEGFSNSIADFAIDDFEYHNLSAGTTINSYNSDMNQWRQMSFFGRVQYTFNDKYLFTFNGRYDGNSKFGKENKWAFFPSGAIAWRLGDEAFIEQLGVFSDMKLRASYGISGSEALGPYNSLSALEANSNAYVIGDAPVVGFTPSRLPNPDLRWEQTTQLDIGLDFGVLNGRVNFVLDYFSKETNDLFLDKPVPETSGVNTIKDNIGSLRNSGFEFAINTTPVAGDFTWRMDFNGTFQQSEILNLGAEKDIITGFLGGGLRISQTQIMEVGQPLGTFLGYRSAGTWSTTDDLEAYTQFGTPVEAGDMKLVDVNGDGDVNADDRQIIGYAQPRFYGGFNNYFTYKGLDLSIFFQYVSGNDVFNATSMSIRNTGGYSNKHIDLRNAWTPENQNTDIPRAGSVQPGELIDTYLENASFVRMREVSLGYSLPAQALERLHLSRARFYITGTNLLTFTKYTGYDPEVNIAGGSIDIINLDNGSYPRAKSIILGLNLTF